MNVIINSIKKGKEESVDFQVYDMLYYNKGLVPTPSLQMVDDILGIQVCSKKFVKLNNTFMELEKLNHSDEKCHNVHMGKKLADMS